MESDEGSDQPGSPIAPTFINNDLDDDLDGLGEDGLDQDGELDIEEEDHDSKRRKPSKQQKKPNGPAAPVYTASGRLVKRTIFYGDQDDDDDSDFQVVKKKKKTSKAKTKKKPPQEKKPKQPKPKKAPAEKKSKTKAAGKKKKKVAEEENEEPEEVEEEKNREYEPDYVEELSASFPDRFWTTLPPLQTINAKNPLSLVKTNIAHPGYIHSLAISHGDGAMVASCSTIGSVRLWDVSDWSLISEIRDKKEEKIEEFFNVLFSFDNRRIIAAGKLKFRDRWSEEEDENVIAPAPIKVFDIKTGEVILKLEGHTEEITCVKMCTFKGENFLLSSSQDGRIIRWALNSDWSGPVPSDKKKKVTIQEDPSSVMTMTGEFIDDMTSHFVFSMAFVPNTGNKYFLGACDDGVKLYDFEERILLQSFGDLYSCYCDCVKFVDCIELNQSTNSHFFITRGVELLKEDDTMEMVEPNKCRLSQLIRPNGENGNQWSISHVQSFSHSSYISNSWPTKITSNGKYLVAPTSYGNIVIWNIRSTKPVATLADHEYGGEVRDIIFHPTLPYLFSCAHDGTIKVYEQKPEDGIAKPPIITSSSSSSLSMNHTASTGIAPSARLPL